MSEKDILNEIIIAYRKTIEERYVYANLKQQYDLPAFFNEERVAQFRTYFLEYVYPHPTRREDLNDAFDSLDNYIRQPEKLLRLVIDSSRLIFKYGRHLRKILNAGLKALKSFRAATRFEDSLVQTAMTIPLEPPYEPKDIRVLLADLSRSDIDAFVQNNRALFEILYDRPLIKKIIEIVEHLIAKMKKRPKVYGPEEIKGLEIGRDIIKEGNALFSQLTLAEQQQVLDLVIRIEEDVLYDILS